MDDIRPVSPKQIWLAILGINSGVAGEGCDLKTSLNNLSDTFRRNSSITTATQDAFGGFSGLGQKEVGKPACFF